MGSEKGVSSYLQHLPVVIPPANLEVRRTQDVHPQLRQQRRRRLETGTHQQTVLVRVALDGLVDTVTTLLLSVDHFKAERRLCNAVNLSDTVPALVVEKRCAIGDQELQVTDLWCIDGRVVDFGDAPAIERVPDAAGC